MVKSKRILIVEDDVHLRRAIVRMMESSGFLVTQAENGDIGQYLGLLFEYDLLVADIGMPGVDGISMTKFIKARTSTPVILITGLERKIVEPMALEAKADFLLIKPFSATELLKVVKEILPKS